MIVLRATVVIKPDRRDRWLQIVAALLPPARAEDACQAYAVCESIESPNTFVFVEEWATVEAFHAHNRTPHVTAFFDALPDLTAEPPEGSIYEVSSLMTLDQALMDAGVARDSGNRSENTSPSVG